MNIQYCSIHAQIKGRYVCLRMGWPIQIMAEHGWWVVSVPPFRMGFHASGSGTFIYLGWLRLQIGY